MRYLKQRISLEEKIKDDFEWAKRNADRILDDGFSDWYINGSQSNSFDSRVGRMMRSYRLYNNEIEDEDFENYFNTLKFDLGQKSDKIMPYNKAHNKINVLVGEMISRPFDFKAMLTNIEGARAVTKVREELLTQYMMAVLEKENAIQEISMAPDIPDEQKQQALAQVEQAFAQVKNPEQIEEYIKDEYLEPREIKANKVLETLYQRQRLLDKKKDSYKHALLSDEEHVWIGIENNETVIKVLNPIGVIYHKSPDVKYVQDGDYAGYKTRMTVADIFDTFDLTDEQISTIEERFLETQTGTPVPNKDFTFERDTSFQRMVNGMSSPSTGQYGRTHYIDVEVGHCEWRSLRKIGFLTYIDENKSVATEIVDDSFPFNKEDPSHISIEYDYVPEVWECVRIDNDIYTNIRPVPYQFVDVDNPYKQPLRYHGVAYNNTNSESVSVMERMRPYQLLYLVVMHRLKKLIARDKGMVIPIDTSRLDSTIGLEETLYYLDELDIYLYNGLEGATEDGAAQRSALESPVVRTTSNHIIQYINLLSYIEDQIGEVAGVSKPREGQTSQYEAVTNAQQSIAQSSIITQMLSDTHVRFWETVLNDAVDLATRFYDEVGHESPVMDSNFRRSNLSIKPGEFNNCKFGVFVISNPRDNAIYNDLKSMAQAILSNPRGRLSDVLKILKQRNSIEELTRDIEKFEAYVNQQNEADRAANQDMAKQKIEAEERKDIRDKQHISMENQLDRESNERIAEIRSFTMMQDQDINDNNVPDQLELDKVRMSERIENRKLDVKETEIASKERIAAKKAEADKVKARSKSK